MRNYQRLPLILLCFFFSLALAACGGTSGSAVGHTANCDTSPKEGHCQGSFRRIKGTYSEEIPSVNIRNGAELRVAVSASIETGEARVYVRSQDGEEPGMVLKEGEEGRFDAVITVDGIRDPRLYFEVVGEQIEGVAYTYHFWVQ